MGTQAGWYPDPQVQDQERWWDGERWWDEVRPSAPYGQLRDRSDESKPVNLGLDLRRVIPKVIFFVSLAGVVFSLWYSKRMIMSQREYDMLTIITWSSRLGLLVGGIWMARSAVDRWYG